MHLDTDKTKNTEAHNYNWNIASDFSDICLYMIILVRQF